MFSTSPYRNAAAELDLLLLDARRAGVGKHQPRETLKLLERAIPRAQDQVQVPVTIPIDQGWRSIPTDFDAMEWVLAGGRALLEAAA